MTDAPRRVYAVGSGSAYDSRRNTSEAHPDPSAYPEWLKTCEWYTRTKPEWYRWIVNGRPELTPEEYERVRSDSQRRRKAAQRG